MNYPPVERFIRRHYEIIVLNVLGIFPALQLTHGFDQQIRYLHYNGYDNTIISYYHTICRRYQLLYSIYIIFNVNVQCTMCLINLRGWGW